MRQTYIDIQTESKNFMLTMLQIMIICIVCGGNAICTKQHLYRMNVQKSYIEGETQKKREKYTANRNPRKRRRKKLQKVLSRGIYTCVIYTHRALASAFLLLLFFFLCADHPLKCMCWLQLWIDEIFRTTKLIFVRWSAEQCERARPQCAVNVNEQSRATMIEMQSADMQICFFPFKREVLQFAFRPNHSIFGNRV